MSPGEQFSPPQLERWWLVFTPPVEPGWWKVFLTPGFGHVYAIRQPQSGVCIVVNPLVHRVENAIALERASDLIDQALAQGYRVLVYTKHTREYNAHTDVRVGRGWIITCASFLAYLMGIHFSWRCTPYQLYRAALGQGAEELHERRQKPLQSPEAEKGQGRREALGRAACERAQAG